MSPEMTTIIAAAVTAVGASLGTLALVPKLLKGEIVFKREMEQIRESHQTAMSQQKQSYEDILALKNGQIVELRAAVHELTEELKEQSREQSAGMKELINAIQFVQSLANARIERRGG